MRNMSAHGVMMYDITAERCAKCIHKLLNRAQAAAEFTPKSLAFYEAVVKAQAAVKRLLPFKLLRYQVLLNAFKRERDGLVKYFDHPRVANKYYAKKMRNLRLIFVDSSCAA